MNPEQRTPGEAASTRPEQSPDGPSGILAVNKPRGATSAGVVHRLRRITGVRRSGHAGTLDPLAEGVLIVCLGRATRLVESIMHLVKIYRATARLDVTNASFDLELPLEDAGVAAPPPREAVLAAAARFEGHIMQIPPVWSAARIGGKRAYQLARRGRTMAVPPRPVTLYWLVVHRYDWPEVEFEVACARGTYIRSLIRDWGAALGTGGCLTALVRTAVGPFTIEHAAHPDDFDRRPLHELLVPLETARELIARCHDVVPPRPA